VALRRSVDCYKDVELRHAVLHGVGHGEVDPSTTILGHEAKLPFFVTSCAGQRMFHADGEVATAKAAEKHGVRMALSQLTTSTFEDVRAAAPNSAKCLQLYVWRDRALLKEVLDRAKEVGFTSLALTADFSWVGNRERETKTGFTVPPSYSVQQCVDAARSPAWTFDFMSRVPYGYKAVPDADFPAESLVDFIAQQMKPEFDWKDAEWLCQEWGDTGPVALKGVARGGGSNEAYRSFYKGKERKNVKRTLMQLGLKNMTEDEANFMHDSLTVIAKEKRDEIENPNGPANRGLDLSGTRELTEEESKIDKEDVVMWFRAMGWIWSDEQVFKAIDLYKKVGDPEAETRYSFADLLRCADGNMRARFTYTADRVKEVENIVAVFADKSTGSLMRSDLQRNLLTGNALGKCEDGEVQAMFEKLEYGPNNLTFKVADMTEKLARKMSEYPHPGVPPSAKPKKLVG